VPHLFIENAGILQVGCCEVDGVAAPKHFAIHAQAWYAEHAALRSTFCVLTELVFDAGVIDSFLRNT
jgi:hypothetical protein